MQNQCNYKPPSPRFPMNGGMRNGGKSGEFTYFAGPPSCRPPPSRSDSHRASLTPHRCSSPTACLHERPLLDRSLRSPTREGLSRVTPPVTRRVSCAFAFHGLLSGKLEESCSDHVSPSSPAACALSSSPVAAPRLPGDALVPKAVDFPDRAESSRFDLTGKVVAPPAPRFLLWSSWISSGPNWCRRCPSNGGSRISGHGHRATSCAHCPRGALH